MDEKKFLIVQHGHSLLFLLLFSMNFSTRRLFLLYVRFKALAGADSELGFDPFMFNWKTVNGVVLALNVAAVAGILLSLFLKDTYPKFWPYFAFVFFINVLYPSGVIMLYMTGFHFILFSIMLVNGYGLFALVFLRKKWGLVQPLEPDTGVNENE